MLNEEAEWMKIPDGISDISSMQYNSSGIMEIRYVKDGAVTNYYLDMDTQKQIDDTQTIFLKYDGDYYIEDASGYITKK